MARKLKLARILQLKGYVPSQGLTGQELVPVGFGGTAYTLIDGQNCWCRGSRVEGALGVGSVGTTIPVAVLMNVGNTHGGITTAGSIVSYFNQYIGAGTGSMVVGGVNVGGLVGASLTEVPQSGGTPKAVGLAAPTAAPVIAAIASPPAGKNTGSASILLTRIRSATGEESNRGPVSNVITCSSQGVKITSTAVAMGLGGSGDDKFGIYVSQSGFSTVGPWFHLYDDVVSALTGNYTIQLPGSTLTGWYDGEVGIIAPLNFNQPLPCSFVGTLNNILLAIGVAVNGISPSIPGKVGAFPPEWIVFLSGGGTVTWCKATGFDGQLMVGTANSTYLVRAMGGTASPITVNQVYPTTGFANGNLVCFVQHEFYGWNGSPIRGGIEGGELDTTFGAYVETRFKSLGGCDVVAYDPNTDCVLYIKGNKALPWDRKRQHWQPVQLLTAAATTAVTDGQICRISDSAGNLVALEKGTGVAWFGIPDFREDEPFYNKTLRRFGASGNATLTFDILINTDVNTSQQQIQLDTSKESVFQHINVHNAKSFTAKISGDGTLVNGGPQAFFEGAFGYIVRHIGL